MLVKHFRKETKLSRPLGLAIMPEDVLLERSSYCRAKKWPKKGSLWAFLPWRCYQRKLGESPWVLMSDPNSGFHLYRYHKYVWLESTLSANLAFASRCISSYAIRLAHIAGIAYIYIDAVRFEFYWLLQIPQQFIHRYPTLFVCLVFFQQHSHHPK